MLSESTITAIASVSIPVMGTIATTVITAVINRSSKAIEAVNQRLGQVESNQERLETIATGNRKGGVANMRWVLINEMRSALTRGWDTYENFEEVVNLYDIYKENGGNGPVDALFAEYSKLKKKGATHESN